MEGKKISFGFMKTKKQDKPNVVEKKDYIECVEEKSIKIVGGEILKEENPLVIPMKPNTLITVERLKEIAEEAENFDNFVSNTENNNSKVKDISKHESIDQMVVRELVEDATSVKVMETPKLIVPINVLPVVEEKTESTLDDYESVPIQEFGMAMLRGMGWTPQTESTYKLPKLRPKGLGLGADNIVKQNKKKQTSKDKEEELTIVKNAFVRITSGKHSGYYGKVISLDEDNGRAMIDITIKKETVSFSEFMLQPVSKSEFDKQSKVINTESFEEYKNNENQSNLSRNYKGMERTASASTRKIQGRTDEPQLEAEYHSNGRSRDRSGDIGPRMSSSSAEETSKHRQKHKMKYSSNDTISSDSDHRQAAARKRYSSDSSSSSNKRKHKSSKSKRSKVKRDIDKKRKGKKKKRDRDRSPNYKKHRK